MGEGRAPASRRGFAPLLFRRFRTYRPDCGHSTFTRVVSKTQERRPPATRHGRNRPAIRERLASPCRSRHNLRKVARNGRSPASRSHKTGVIRRGRANDCSRLRRLGHTGTTPSASAAETPGRRRRRRGNPDTGDRPGEEKRGPAYTTSPTCPTSRQHATLKPPQESVSTAKIVGSHAERYCRRFPLCRPRDCSAAVGGGP